MDFLRLKANFPHSGCVFFSTSVCMLSAMQENRSLSSLARFLKSRTRELISHGSTGREVSSLFLPPETLSSCQIPLPDPPASFLHSHLCINLTCTSSLLLSVSSYLQSSQSSATLQPFANRRCYFYSLKNPLNFP